MPEPLDLTARDTVAAFADLYWLFKWYRDEYPDAVPPADLVKFDGSSDVVGRARSIIWPPS